MIALSQYELLCTPEVRSLIEANIERDPAGVAFDKRIPHAALVATQVKYLQRARTKLPAWYAARCILPPRAFEQASSEECAGRKSCSGRSVIDLTCGLGVDAWALARRFDRVVTIERDEVLAAVARENFRRLGVENIEVVCAAAEEFLERCDAQFDWVYADPDRRSAAGRKLVRLEDCSPDVAALRERIAHAAPRFCLKLSPLFDVNEAFRLFGACRVEVVSLGGECKEVVVYADGSGSKLTAVAIGIGEFSGRSVAAAEAPFRPQKYNYLFLPDVALQKARLVTAHLQGRVDCWSENGFGFAAERVEGLLGRWIGIERIEPYNPRALKKEFPTGVTVLKKEFPLPVPLREGGNRRIALTKIGQDYWTVYLS